MLEPREADIPVLFLVLVVLPLVAYILLGKWSEAAKKRERINFLEKMAAEEAFSAQEMPTADVIPLSTSKNGIHVCARCFCPATTRCSKCKSVRYCSGKCQIIHWRRVHKHECQQLETISSCSSPNATTLEGSILERVSIIDNLNSFYPGYNVKQALLDDVPSTNTIHPSITNEVSAATNCSAVDASQEDMLHKRSTDKRVYCKSNREMLRRKDMAALDSVEEAFGMRSANLTSNDTSNVYLNGQDSASAMHVIHKHSPQLMKSFESRSKYELSGLLHSGKNEIKMPANEGDFTLNGGNMSSVENTFNDETVELNCSCEKPVLKGCAKGKCALQPAGTKIYKSSKSTVRVFGEQSYSEREGSGEIADDSKVVRMGNSVAALGSNRIASIGIMKMMGLRKSTKLARQDISELNAAHKKVMMLFPYEEFIKIFNYEVVNLSPRGLLNCGNRLKENDEQSQYHVEFIFQELKQTAEPLEQGRLHIVCVGGGVCWRQAEKPFIHNFLRPLQICYANAVLQCLTCTKPLIIFLLQRSHSRACTCCGKDWCLMCELEKHVMMLRESGGPLSPSRILLHMRNINCQIGDGSQEDAHEFLRLLVASMQSICLKGIGGEDKVNPILQETTFIQHTFGGRLWSKVKCLRCHHESERCESIMDLTLEIFGWVESLEDALTQFTTPEELDGENMYRCGRCATYVRARKQLSIHEAPNILTIVLKRFQEGKYGKINKCITFPDMLDMIPFMTGMGDIPPLYMLYAVVVHLDSLNASFSGHYVAYVKDLHGKWFRVDDTEVHPVPMSQVMSEGAYILFYIRSCPRPQIEFYEKAIQQQVPATIRRYTSSRTQKPSRKGHSKSSSHFLGPETLLDLKPENTTNHINRNDTKVMEFSDATSSDWSLFTSSDEASFTTESTRDSFSTVDYTHACNGDRFSSIFNNLYAPQLSSPNTLCRRTFSNSRLQTRFIPEERGYVLNSYLSTQPPKGLWKGDGFEHITDSSAECPIDSYCTRCLKYGLHRTSGHCKL